MADTQPQLYFFRNQAYFLKENFIINDEELLQKFTTSIEHLCYFTLEMDKIIDGDYKVNSIEVKNYDFYSAVKSHQESVRIMTEIFPKDHGFWDHLDENNLQYYTTLSREKHNTLIKPILTLKEFEEYAVAKHALAFIPIIGLNYIFSSRGNTEKLKEVYTFIFKGIQMNDDIEDLSADIQNDQWTYVRSRVEEFIKENNLDNESGLDKFEERVFYVSGIAEELIAYSKEQFINARNIALENDYKEIVRWLDETISDLSNNEELVSDLVNN
ncbi:hypothetical protein [Chryseobacterium shigense]|uniref:Uncharacterized protein n=1 Tax=Chryseobacterium shigense TaxID=297244 RepID=A0A841NBL5_9FLAO|nr:hypothetical protein [Chryseobacterium shigense]MBB6371098.1 hypothetical protein [Chryseobacterium shigense]